MDRLWYLIAVLSALLLTTILGIWGYNTAEDAATATGPVVTALATIGAAIFGIAVGREAGKSEGREDGVVTGRKQVAKEVAAHETARNSGSALADVGRGGSPRASTLSERMQEIIAE
jgi:hypothetical protein